MPIVFWDEIVVRATAYDPAERYESARELHDAIETFLGADRDIVLRRKLAAEHLIRAQRFEIESDREGALREVGRALALAPERDQVFVVPAAAVAMALGQVLGAPARVRPYVPLFASAALVVPAFLAQWHVLDLGGFYGTPERTIVVVRGVLVLWQHSLHAALAFAALATLFVAAAYAASYRDVLEDMDATNRARVHALSRLVQPTQAK